MAEIDLSKPQPLENDSKTIQKINFTRNLAREGISNTLTVLK